MRLLFSLFCAIAFVSGFGVLKAQVTVVINPVKDNTLFESGSGGTSSGSGGTLFAGKTNTGAIRRAVMQFDVAAAIPPGVIITSATLTMMMDLTIAGPTNTNLFPLTQSWGEGASIGSGGGAASQTGDATWIHRFFPDSLWTNPGGDFNGISSAGTVVAGNGVYNWTSPQVVTDVQAWLDAPSTNFGWMLMGEETAAPTAKRFGSRENTTPASRPQLSITYQLPAVSVSGTCMSPNGDSIHSVQMRLTGTNTDSVISSADGRFTFSNLTSGGTDTLRPSKNNDTVRYNGVSTLDIVLVRRHILNNDTLSGPYKILAADVNGSGAVSSLDLVFMRRLILGVDSTFNGNRLWAFVPSGYVFPDSLNIWTPAAPPAERVFVNMTTSQSAQNFVGVKLGDVNDSWNPGTAKTYFNGAIYAWAENVCSPVGDVFSVPVKVKDFRRIAGFQFTMKWDPEALEFTGTKAGAVQPEFGLHGAQTGMLTLSWNPENGGLHSLEDNSIIFELNFRPLKKAGSETNIYINSDFTPAEAYDENLNLLEIKSIDCKVRIVEKRNDNPPEPFIAFPDPFTNKLCIRFTQPVLTNSKLCIFNLSGQKIKEFRTNEGPINEDFHWDAKQENVAPGFYIIHFENGEEVSHGCVFYQTE